MYSIDTIHIEVPYYEYYNMELQDEVTINNSKGLRYKKGHINDLCIKVYIDKIKIECSLPKLIKGNNIWELKRDEVSEAIMLIEKLTGLPIIERGLISRIDIFSNILTEQVPRKYFSVLGGLRYFRRFPVSKTSLYYSNRNRSICFYDKTKEMKNNNKTIPEIYTDKNIMRVEARFKKVYLKKRFSRGLTVAILLTDEGILKLTQELKKMYKAIHKEHALVFNPFDLSSRKNLLEVLAYEGLKSMGGTEEVIQIIENSRNAKNIRSEYISRRKKEVRELAKKVSGIKEIKVGELDKKILKIE